MKKINKMFQIYFFVFILILFISVNVYAIDTSLIEKVERLENEFSRIEQNQLNYKIEKNLLREAFSSNLKTINLVLTIILVLFTIIGYLGVRDIGKLKNEYSTELQELNNIKNNFENKLKSFSEKYDEIKSDFEEMNQEDKKQNKKIKVLELKEKIRDFINRNNYIKALEYLDVALNLEPRNITLLYMEAEIYTKMQILDKAINSCKKILKIYPEDHNVIANLLELYLLTGNFVKYNELFDEFYYSIKSFGGIGFIKYLNILKNFQLEDYEKVESLIKEYLMTMPKKTKEFNAWSYNELLNVINEKEDNTINDLIKDFIHVLQDKVRSEDILDKYFN